MEKATEKPVVEGGVNLDTLVAWVEDAAESSIDARKKSERDRDYYDNIQWTSEEETILEERGQPAVVKNRIAPKIDFLVGLEQERRTDPKAYPRTPNHDDDAEAATDALRYICDDTDFDQIRSEVFKNIAIEGAGGAIIEVKERPGKLAVEVTQIPWDRMITDPRSRKADYSDSRFKGLYIWLDKDEAELKYPEKKDEIALAFSDATTETHDDKPSYWLDRKRDRIRLIELYYRQGQRWYRCVFTKGAHIVDPAESPYQDEYGISSCPIEFISGFIDRQNNRYGLARRFIGPQDEINKRTSKSLHLLSHRQVIAERGAVDDVDEAKKELAKADGYVERNNGYEFEIQPTNDMAQGNLALLQDAKQEIDAVSANASLTGKDPRAQSGRALEARQQGGLIEVGTLFDRLRLWQLRAYRQMWARVRQYWTEETWVRVTDDESNIKFVGLNQRDPMTGQLVNPVAEMSVDILVEDAPNTVNIQSEQFELLVEMYRSAPDRIPLEMVIEASSLRNKKALLEKMAPPEQAQAEEQQRKQVEIAGAVAEVEKTQSETQENLAQAQKYGAEAVMQPQLMPPSF